MHFYQVLTCLLLNVFASEIGVVNELVKSGCHPAPVKGKLYNPRTNTGNISSIVSPNLEI